MGLSAARAAALAVGSALMLAVLLLVGGHGGNALAVVPGLNGKIAFHSDRGTGSNYEIVAMSPDGSGQTNLTNNPAGDYDPAWSPDGTKIAFYTNRGTGGNFEVYVMNADGSGQRNLTRTRDRHERWFTWSSGSEVAQ